MISAAQLVTDVGNWSNIQAGAAVTLLAVTGRSTLASLKTLATPMLPAFKGLPALLPSAGLAAAAGAPGAAAAATAGTGGTVIGSIATTLKLPAAMLLKRPLAAGAAAGSAGAAAAAMRDTSGTAAAAAAAGNGSSSRGPSRAWGAVGRPLQSIGDGMTHGVRSAVLGLRRFALGNTRALQQLHKEPLVVPEEAFAGAAAAAGPRRGFWASRSSSVAVGEQPARKWFGFSSRNSQMQLVSQPDASMLAAPAATAAAAGGSSTWQQSDHEQEQPARRRPFAQFGQNVGRHVIWLGSAAARASGQLALLAFGGGRVAQYAAPAAAGAVVTVGDGPSRGVLVHSVSSHQLQDPLEQQQPGLELGQGRRSLSMPSLLGAGGDAGAVCSPVAGAAGPVSFSVSSSNGRDGSGRDGSGSGSAGRAMPLGGADLTFMWDGGSSSITCSSFGSKSTGVGRQTLNLLAPRISWGKRATQAMIVRQ